VVQSRYRKCALTVALAEAVRGNIRVVFWQRGDIRGVCWQRDDIRGGCWQRGDIRGGCWQRDDIREVVSEGCVGAYLVAEVLLHAVSRRLVSGGYGYGYGYGYSIAGYG
jgi:hypothetical protein